MKSLKRIIVALVTSLFVAINTVPSVIYANEMYKVTQEQQVEQSMVEIDQKLSKPLEISDEEIETLIQKNKALYPNLTEEQMRDIAYKAVSPYTSRGSIWDGQGVTLSEFAWAFDVIVSSLLGGIGSIPQYAAKKGLAAAKAMLSRAAVAAAKRVGVYAGIIPGILAGLFNVLSIYGSLGYAVAKYIDARDYHPNNGRINVWA